MRAWQRWAEVSAFDRPEAWVRTVAWRLAVGRWRRATAGVRAMTRHGAASEFPGPTPDGVALLAALRRLPVHQREAIILHHVAELSVEEIAAQLNVPEGTVKSRLSRGRAELAELLKEGNQ